MKRILLILVLLFFKKGFSQDPVFTQFYVIPETINSGFTANTWDTKAGIIHRVQWPKLNFSINTQFAYFDKWFEQIMSLFFMRI